MPWSPPPERFWYYVFGRVGNAFHVMFAKKLSEMCNYEFEAWTFGNIKREFVHKERNLTYKGIPYVKGNYLSYLKLLFTVLRMTKTGSVIIHFHGDRTPSTWACYVVFTFAKKLTKKISLIVQSHGFFKPIFADYIERHLLKSMDMIYAITPYELRHLSSRLGLKKVRMSRVGIDIQHFRPMNKAKCREILEWPKDAFIVLYVSRFIELKGLELIVRAIRELRTKRNNLTLVAIGGLESDPLYKMVKNETRFIYLTLFHSELPVFYNAADVTCNYIRGMSRTTGGIGVPLMESLACGTPVLSNTLRYNLDHEDITRAGADAQDYATFVEKLSSLMDRRPSPMECRAVAEKYYDFNKIALGILQDYQRMLGNQD